MPMQEKEAAAWRHYVAGHDALHRARTELLVGDIDRVGLFRELLGGRDALLALPLCLLLPVAERQQLFPEIVRLARSVHGPYNLAWELILALPRHWVVEHVEPIVEGILQDEEEHDYWMFLNLYKQLDPDLTARLARRALAHSNPDIRDLAADHHAVIEQVKANGH